MTVRASRSPDTSIRVFFLAERRNLLVDERRVKISHYLQRRSPVRVTHKRVNLGVSRSIIEATDWHAQDR
jgi:hypothetical protein